MGDGLRYVGKKRGPRENKLLEQPAVYDGACRSVAELRFDIDRGAIAGSVRQADAIFQRDARSAEQLERSLLGAPCREGGRFGILRFVVAIFARRKKLFAQTESTRSALFQVDADACGGRERQRYERARVGDADVGPSRRQIGAAVRPVANVVAAQERAAQQQAFGQPLLTALV